jgi:hypothetical protein
MKKYVEAELEVIEFDEEDVITASCSADNWQDHTRTPEMPIKARNV